MDIKAIPTRYKGYHFRSMSEARWAVFMDHMGIEWGYEVQGFETPWGPYLPDFCARGARGDVWIEVKGKQPDRVEQLRLAHVIQASPQTPGDTGFGPFSEPVGLMVWGLSSNLQLACCYGPGDYCEAGIDDGYQVEESYSDGVSPGGHATIPEMNKPYGGWLWSLLACGLVSKRARARKVQEAVYAARSARFDRGQAPT